MDKETGSDQAQETVGRIAGKILQIKNQMDAKMAARLQLDLIERIARRLAEIGCGDCKSMLSELDQQVTMILSNHGSIDKPAMKMHGKLVSGAQTHLMQKHQMVTEGYYMSVFMSLGMSIGLVFGLTLFDNIAFGLPIGLALGLAIGSGLDADAKKKGKVI